MSFLKMLEKSGVSIAAPKSNHERKLELLIVGSDAIVIRTKETFTVKDRSKSNDIYYIYGTNGKKYRLDEVEHDWYTANQKLENWDDKNLKEVASWLELCVEDDDEETFNLLRQSYSREVLKACGKFINKSAVPTVQAWLKSGHRFAPGVQVILKDLIAYRSIAKPNFNELDDLCVIKIADGSATVKDRRGNICVIPLEILAVKDWD